MERDDVLKAKSLLFHVICWCDALQCAQLVWISWPGMCCAAKRMENV